MGTKSLPHYHHLSSISSSNSWAYLTLDVQFSKRLTSCMNETSGVLSRSRCAKLSDWPETLTKRWEYWFSPVSVYQEGQTLYRYPAPGSINVCIAPKLRLFSGISWRILHISWRTSYEFGEEERWKTEKEFLSMPRHIMWENWFAEGAWQRGRSEWRTEKPLMLCFVALLKAKLRL